MKPCRILFSLWALLLVAVVGQWCVGTRLAQVLAARFGDTILQSVQGKIPTTAVSVFIRNRVSEMLWLAALALLWGTAHWLFENLSARRSVFGRHRWVVHAVAGFVFLNLWIGAASNTALFWGVMGLGAGTENLMQFELKRILLEESPSPHRAVLVGNSQTRAQIDEGQLNAALGDRLWTTELHWPGSQGFDLLPVERQIRKANPDLVICYLTEIYFYGGVAGESIPPFLRLRDIPDYMRRGVLRRVQGDKILYGIMSNLLPLFRCREVLAKRFLGEAAVSLKQEEYNTDLEADLRTRARETASHYRIDGAAEIQKQALEDFIVRCRKLHRRVVLLAGQSNPIFEDALDPALRADMLSYLEQIKSRYDNVILIEDTPTETAEDYEDLTHVNKDTQRRFSAFLAGRLHGLLFENQPQAK